MIWLKPAIKKKPGWFNAIKINGEKINDLDYQITDECFIDNTYIIIKRGKKNYYVGKKK